jgi:hypothetical protein
VVQAIELPLCNHEALNSNPIPIKKTKQKDPPPKNPKKLIEDWKCRALA